MGLREELQNIDLEAVADTFDQLFATSTGDEAADLAFAEGEQEFAYGQYPVFATIRDKFERAVPAMEASGMTRAHVAAVLTGMDIVATVLATCASSEIEDLP